MTDKQILRTKLMAARRLMAGADVKNISQKITAQVLDTTDWTAADSLHIYLPLGNEADTRPLLRSVRQTYPQIRVASWRKTGGDYRAHWLQDGGFGEAVAPGYKFDVIVVPALGFNAQNFRLGRGGGFYDRFLAAQPQAYTVGLCYSFGRCSFRPEPHDIPLHAIVTEVMDK